MVVFDVAKADAEEIVITGPVSAELYVSSDAVDTDFMVRVSDVYNDEAGTVRLLQVSLSHFLSFNLAIIGFNLVLIWLYLYISCRHLSYCYLVHWKALIFFHHIL